MIEQTVTLYCTEGGSDKVYKAEVASGSGGYVVNFWYGPRTGTLRPGTKTKSPVSKEKAIDIWERLVRSKKAKGYHEGADAPAYTGSDGTSKDTGIRPMLLTPDTEENIEKYIQDDAWGGQEVMGEPSRASSFPLWCDRVNRSAPRPLSDDLKGSLSVISALFQAGFPVAISNAKMRVSSQTNTFCPIAIG